MPADAFGTNLDIAMADLTRAKTEYLKVFGQHSLERVTLLDPVHPVASEYKLAAKKLWRAIKTKQAIPQFDKEIWDTVIFLTKSTCELQVLF